MKPDDTLILKVGDQQYQGWQAVRVTRGLERMPSDFQIIATESFPGQNVNVIARPGDAVEVHIGADKVLTGYLDRICPSIGPEEHNLALTGRSKCQDLVDCSALATNLSVNSVTSVIEVAKALVDTFNKKNKPENQIQVIALSQGLNYPFNLQINLGETPYEIIETLARFEGLLVFDDRDGNLVLDRVGTQRHASGFMQGVNVQAAQTAFSMDERFSEYIAVLSSAFTFQQLSDANLINVVPDPTVPRFRPRVIASALAQQTSDGFQKMALVRAVWEMTRRRGRSQQIQLTCDSWRDSSGKLWEPNYLAPVHVPACKVENQTWCIGEVTYERKGETGTTAQVMLMPPEAFSIEPQDQLAISLELAQAQTQARAKDPGFAARRDQ